jgi:hypothetical protein
MGAMAGHTDDQLKEVEKILLQFNLPARIVKHG